MYCWRASVRMTDVNRVADALDGLGG